MNYLLQEPVETEPLAAEPVTLDEAKNWMAKDLADTTDDDLIELLITAARRQLERFTGLSFGTKELSILVELDGCAEPYRLPFGPVQSVEGITLDRPFQDDLTLADGTDYELVGLGQLRTRTEGIHTIQYTTGYTTLPEDLKEDVLRVTAWLYQNRGIRFEASTDPIPFPEWGTLNANRYIQTVI